MSVSIDDVASRACVSRGTVSKVLNGSRERIGLATQERVRRAASELGYRPNAIARSLRRRRTDVLGVYSGHRNPLWLVQEFQNACERHRKDLLIHGAFRVGSVDDVIGELADGKIDGLLFIPDLHDPLTDRLAATPAAAGVGTERIRRLPVVAVADGAPGLPSVVADDWTAGRLMAEHLHERGHRNVLYRSAWFPRMSTVRRGDAFLSRARELGLTVRTPAPTETSETQLSDEEIGLLTASLADRPTAIACYSEDVVFTVLHAALRLGLRVPDDLALITTGGSTLR